MYWRTEVSTGNRDLGFYTAALPEKHLLRKWKSHNFLAQKFHMIEIGLDFSDIIY